MLDAILAGSIAGGVTAALFSWTTLVRVRHLQLALLDFQDHLQSREKRAAAHVRHDASKEVEEVLAAARGRNPLPNKFAGLTGMPRGG